MLEWLRLLIFSLVIAVANGSAMECDEIQYLRFCWTSFTRAESKDCWYCVIQSERIHKGNVLTISGELNNGSYVDADIVQFEGGIISKMPKIYQQFTHHEIVQVDLWETHTKVVNAEFFANSGRNFKVFGILKSTKLSVESSAFQNWTSLQYLYLGDNRLRSVPFDAFIGLHNLVWLDLSMNRLRIVYAEWMVDLGNLEELNLSWNQLKLLPNDAFHKLTKLRRLCLNNNRIETLGRKLFQWNRALEKIILSDNVIKEIQMGSFQYLKLTLLNLMSNNCTDMVFMNDTKYNIERALRSCYPKPCIPLSYPNSYSMSDYSYEEYEDSDLSNCDLDLKDNDDQSKK